jgi:tRNA(adenine34) deaminase
MIVFPAATEPFYNPGVADAAFTAADEAHMRRALALAAAASSAGEVPVGAVLVYNGAVQGEGANRTRRDGVVQAHAELLALAEAERSTGDFRLDNAEMYVTVEPCLMCLGALHQARLCRVVFGCPEPKFGALSRFGLRGHPALERLRLEGGLLADEAAALLGAFFRRLRESA